MFLPAEARAKIAAALTGKDTAFVDIARLRLFPYFASGQRLHADLRIRALNRAGAYACVLMPKKDRGPQWARFVEAGKVLGIYPNQSEHFSKHHDALYATH